MILICGGLRSSSLPGAMCEWQNRPRHPAKNALIHRCTHFVRLRKLLFDEIPQFIKQMGEHRSMRHVRPDRYGFLSSKHSYMPTITFFQDASTDHPAVLKLANSV